MIDVISILKTGVAGSVVALAFASGAFATETLTTSSTGYSGPIIDLAAFQTGNYNFTFGPVSLPGGITFTASPGGSGGYPFGGNSGKGSVIGQGSYGLGANGSFGGAATYIGVDSGTGFDTLTFAHAVSSFGAYFNYAPGFGDDPTISTFDGSTLLATFDLATLAPISTPGGFNEFSFRGITDTSADITSVEFGGSYLLLAGSPSGGIAGGVPEPSTWAMMVIGFAGLGFAGYRQTKGKRDATFSAA